MTPHIGNFTGADASGSDGAKNRVITLTNTSLSSNETVIVDRFSYLPTTDYTVSHLSAGSTITFLGILRNVQKIRIKYFT